MTAPLAALLLAALVGADGEPLAAESIDVRTLPAPLPTDPAAAAWDALPALDVLAAPQRTIRLGDRAANAALATAGLRHLAVRAATDGKDLAVVVDWADATEDRAAPDAIDRYGDGVAIQVPLHFGAGQRLPYVGMGDEQQPVAVFLQRAATPGTVARSAVATGFGTLARRELGPLATGMRRAPDRRGWRAVFVRPLAAGGLDLKAGLVPIALATWDGAGKERGGNKALSGWKFLRFPGQPVDAVFLAEQAWGRRPGDLGDPARGKGIFEGTCTACHQTASERGASPGLAPELTEIGLIATPGYLRDSVLRPSEVIVPNPNPHQHQDRAAQGESRPWPVDEGYVWYALEPDGRKVSTMPDGATLPAADLADLVAYLMTLGAPAHGGMKP